MVWAIVIVVYVGSFLAAYQMFKRDWLKRWDFTVSDRRTFLALSVSGPCSLFAAVLVRDWRAPRWFRDGEEVLVEKRGKQWLT